MYGDENPRELSGLRGCMKKSTGKHRTQKQPRRIPHKGALIGGALLATAAGTLGAVFGVSAYHHANEPAWDSSAPPYYSFGEGLQNPSKPSKDRILIQAWGTVQHTIRGNAHYMDAQPPALNKPMIFLVYSVDDVKKLGVRPKKFYEATVECRKAGELACRVVKAREIEVKNYRTLEEAAIDAANKALPGHDLLREAPDLARQVVIFVDGNQLIKVKCTNPLNYSCTVTAIPSQMRPPAN